MARARKPATSLMVTLGQRLQRFEVRVGNLGVVVFKGRASEPVEVELRDLSQVTEAFNELAPELVQRIRAAGPGPIVAAAPTPRAKRRRRKAVRRD